MELKYLEGKRFCVVFMQADDPDPQQVRLRALHGRANVSAAGILSVEHDGGAFQVPRSCYPQILASDGTDILGDAEYYVICRVSGMDL